MQLVTFPNRINVISFHWRMVFFLFTLAKVKKMSCAGMLTLLDEIFIVVIGVGTWKEKRIHREHSVLSL